MMRARMLHTILLLLWLCAASPLPHCGAGEKIALLFLTRSLPNHSHLWKTLLEESSDKFNVYIHSKKRLKDPFFQQYRIQKIVPTTWSIHAKAWQALIQEAVKDPENVHFAFLSESCIPLYSLDYIYKMIMEDPRTNMAFATKPWWPASSSREVHEIPREFRCGNSEWMVLNRGHAEVVAADRKIIKIISKYDSDQESYFSTLFAIHGCLLDNLSAHSYTYANWTHAVNGGASPYPFTKVDSLSDSLLAEAYGSRALFARKFMPSYPEKKLLTMIREHTALKNR